MSRTPALVVVLALGFAAVTGTIALTKTVHLGQAAAKPHVSLAAIAKRKTQLDRFEASLRAQLKQKPPAIPKLPAVPPAATTPAAASAPAPAASQRVVYVRPAPIVIHKHRAGGEHEGGGEHGDHEGGGDD
jgi:hypothetical protein